MFKSECQKCQDPTKRKVLSAGPSVFKTDRERICCRNYDCPIFDEYRLFPGDKMPAKVADKNGPDDPQGDEKSPKTERKGTSSSRRKSPKKKGES